MAMTFGELIRYVRGVRGIEQKELADAVGLTSGRLYQIETDQGGLPRTWWKLTDELRIPRATAIKSMPRSMALSALASLERAGEPNPLREYVPTVSVEIESDLFDADKFVDPSDVALPPWKPTSKN